MGRYLSPLSRNVSESEQEKGEAQQFDFAVSKLFSKVARI
jgi:hypothetical protein